MYTGFEADAGDSTSRFNPPSGMLSSQASSSQTSNSSEEVDEIESWLGQCMLNYISIWLLTFMIEEAEKSIASLANSLTSESQPQTQRVVCRLPPSFEGGPSLELTESIGEFLDYSL